MAMAVTQAETSGLTTPTPHPPSQKTDDTSRPLSETLREAPTVCQAAGQDDRDKGIVVNERQVFVHCSRGLLSSQWEEESVPSLPRPPLPHRRDGLCAGTPTASWLHWLGRCVCNQGRCPRRRQIRWRPHNRKPVSEKCVSSPPPGSEEVLSIASSAGRLSQCPSPPSPGSLPPAPPAGDAMGGSSSKPSCLYAGKGSNAEGHPVRPRAACKETPPCKGSCFCKKRGAI